MGRGYFQDNASDLFIYKQQEYVTWLKYMQIKKKDLSKLFGLFFKLLLGKTNMHLNLQSVLLIFHIFPKLAQASSFLFNTTNIYRF